MMSASENKVDTSGHNSKSVEETAQGLVNNRDAPACLLAPLNLLLNTKMSNADKERLLAEGVAVVFAFFDDWTVVSQIFCITDPVSKRSRITSMYSEELQNKTYLTLAESFVGRVPAPIPYSASFENELLSKD
jgi:hypothetical protein